MQVVRCQTRVKTVIGEIKAIITAISIRNDAVRYELSYFHEGRYQTIYVERFEFEIDVQEKKQAGFINYDSVKDDSMHTQLLLP